MERLVVGSVVKVISMASDDGRTQHEAAMEYIGRVGKITQDDQSDHFPYRVDFPDADWHFFNHNELEVVQPAPADADAPAAGRAGAGTEGESYELAALRQQLAAANDELSKAKSREKMYKHTVELHEEQYHQERDNARVLYRELRQHVSREQLEAIQKQLNNSVNEDDKLMSDASRGREAMAKLAAAEADNARLRSALEPFAQLAQYYGDTEMPDSADALQDAVYGGRWVVTYGQLRKVFDVMSDAKAAEGAKGE